MSKPIPPNAIIIPGVAQPGECTSQGGTWRTFPPAPGGICFKMPAGPLGVPKPEIPGYMTRESCDQLTRLHWRQAGKEKMRAQYIALGMGIVVGGIAGLFFYRLGFRGGMRVGGIAGWFMGGMKKRR